MKKNTTMKGKHYNHDNYLLFMPNGPTTEPSRTEPRAREVGADSVEVQPIQSAAWQCALGLVSVAVMIPNTRPKSCMHLGWWAGGPGVQGLISWEWERSALTHTHTLVSRESKIHT